MTSRSGIICAGNWIVDLVHDIAHWPDESDLVRIGAQTRGIGGGAANVIAVLAKFEAGLPLWPMGAVGDDGYGAFILEECRGLQLPTTQMTVKAGTPTAHTHVMSVAGQSRTFFYQGGANDVLNAGDFPAGTFAQTNARLFYLGYLTLLGELDRIDSGKTEAAKVLERAQRAGLITAVDLVSGVHPDFVQIVAAAAPFIDYLVLNEVEAARATGDVGTDRESLSRMGRALIAKGVCRAVVIHSAKAVIWSHQDGSETFLPVRPVPADEIASHLGAGDAFCAGLLYAVHEGWAPQDALSLAADVAAASLKGMTASSAIPPLRSLRLELT
jgi:sugar/nucleoside kinase (ribokinase family)